jgi:hypothetical protein
MRCITLRRDDGTDTRVGTMLQQTQSHEKFSSRAPLSALAKVRQAKPNCQSFCMQEIGMQRSLCLADWAARP